MPISFDSQGEPVPTKQKPEGQTGHCREVLLSVRSIRKLDGESRKRSGPASSCHARGTRHPTELPGSLINNVEGRGRGRPSLHTDPFPFLGGWPRHLRGWPFNRVLLRLSVEIEDLQPMISATCLVSSLSSPPPHSGRVGLTAASRARTIHSKSPVGNDTAGAGLSVAPVQTATALGRIREHYLGGPEAWAWAMIYARRRGFASRPYRVERSRHFGGLDRLGDRQSEYRNDRGIAYLADEASSRKKPAPALGSRDRAARAGQRAHQIAWRARLCRRSAFLVCCQLARKAPLRNARARRDLKRAGRCVAALHERRKGRLKDALAHRGFRRRLSDGVLTSMP
mgnify:CR=1 FL=1